MSYTTYKTLPVMLLSETAKVPYKKYEADAGLDLSIDESVTLSTHYVKEIITNIAIEIPKGYVGLIYERSSMAKKGLKVLGGVIDAGYTGPITVFVTNLGQSEIHLNKGERVAQILLLPVGNFEPKLVSSLYSTSGRNGDGLGSTGK